MTWTVEREEQASRELREYLRDKYAPGIVDEGLGSVALHYIKKTESERYGAFVTMEACIDAKATARRTGGGHFNRIVL